MILPRPASSVEFTGRESMMRRRTLLKLMGSGAFAAAWSPSIERLLAASASSPTETIADVEHIIFLMQENRSFDHYFGTLRGVRGFADPRAVTLPSGDGTEHWPGLKIISFWDPAPLSDRRLSSL
jgi:phospholipase C